MRVDQMNLILEATRQTILGKYAPGENDLYVRTLELGQVQESDFFSHILHDDLDSIASGHPGSASARTRPPPTHSPRWRTSRKNSSGTSSRAALRRNDDPRVLRQAADPLRKDFLRGFLGVSANPEPVQIAQEPQQHERKSESLSGASATVQEKVTREHRKSNAPCAYL